MKNIERIGLVFSGGGARGAFQVGAWKALKELKLDQKVVAVYGTSVGAINGAAFLQDDIELAVNIWKNLTFEQVFANWDEEHRRVSKKRFYYQWMKRMVREGGLDVGPLKALLRSSLDEDQIRESILDYGMVVYDLTHRKAKYLRKREIHYGQLIEYIIASATFPVFQPHQIEATKFIDGGIYDNRPIWFLDDRDSLDLVLVIDVTMARHLWRTKKSNHQGPTIYIRPSRLLGSPLGFNKERIRSNMELGYQNTLDQLYHLDA